MSFRHWTVRTAALAATLLVLSCATTDPRSGEVLPTAGKGPLFWTPAEQAVGYRRMEDVFEVRTIERGRRVRPLPRAKGPEPKIAFTTSDGVYGTEDYMREHKLSGVLIIKDGEIILERYGLGRTEKDRWTSFSVAKSVTSILAGAAIKDGHIKSLDDQVVRYIPELAGSGYDGVTVRHLLMMSSGVRWNEDYADANSDVARYSLEPVVPGKNPVVTYMSRLPRAAAPGARFLYNTGETDLAGILVSRATGKTLSAYASEKIWKPYGMEQDAIWMLDAAGHERGGCCISMTLRDYGRVGQFMLDGGAGQLPDGWIAEATSKRIETVAPGRTGGGYGYFWWMQGEGAYDARGIFGQMIYINPTRKLVIVLNSAWPVATGSEYSQARTAYLRAALAAIP